ncbi:MAG: Lrp/AsnC family transcriptional regulator [Promethearchaeota archaeon]
MTKIEKAHGNIQEKLARRSFLDETDMRILNLLQNDARMPLNEIAKRLSNEVSKISKSTVHYRIKRLEEEGVIKGYYAKVDPSKIGEDITIVVNIRAKFGKGYHERIGKKLSKIPGVWAVYFIFGENDFTVIARCKNRKELFEKMQILYNSEDVERTTTQIVGKVVKEDPRIFFEEYL